MTVGASGSEAIRLPAPGRRDFLVLGFGLAILIGFLTVLEMGGGGTQPIAFVLAVMLIFVLVCVVNLETAFILIVAATPFSAEMVLRGTGNALQIPTEPMLFLALFAWGLRFLARGSTTFRQPALTGVLILPLVACLLSIYATPYRILAVKALINLTWYALLGAFIWNNFADKGRLKGLVAAWLAAGVVLCFYSMGCVLAGHFKPILGYWWSEPFFTEHGSYGAWLSFVCVVALSIAVEMEGVTRIALLIVGFLSGVQIVLSNTRGAWLGMGAALVFLVVVSWRRVLKPGNLVPAVMGLLIVGAAISSREIVKGLEKQSATITDPNYQSNLERVNRWYAGWNMFRTHPVTGIGIGTYAQNYAGYRRIALATQESSIHMGIHNEYLKVLAETGVIGFLAALAVGLCLVGVTRRALRATDPFRRGLAVGAAGGLLTYLVHAFVNNYLIYDKAAVPVWASIGILGALDTLQSREPAA